jgi:hypothetical protein
MAKNNNFPASAILVSGDAAHSAKGCESIFIGKKRELNMVRKTWLTFV